MTADAMEVEESKEVGEATPTNLSSVSSPVKKDENRSTEGSQFVSVSNNENAISAIPQMESQNSDSEMQEENFESQTETTSGKEMDANEINADHVNDDADFFFDLAQSKLLNPRRKTRKSKKMIKILLPSSEKEKKMPQKKQPITTYRLPLWDEEPLNSNDWLEFYEETHEDQDPAFIARENQRHQEALQKKIADLDENDMTARAEIQKVVTDLLKEKQAAMERGIESYRERIRQEERKHSTRLQERYHEKKKSNELKIAQRKEQLKMEQAKHMSMALQHHRQQSQQRRLPEQMAAQEWHITSQQVQVKHQQQQQELKQRADEYRRRTEVDFKQEQEKIKQIYEKKLADLETRRTEILSEIVKQLTSSRQRYLKRHLQRTLKEKEILSSQLEQKTSSEDKVDSGKEQEGKTPRDLAKSAVENKQELRPPSPFKSIPDWIDKDKESSVGAVTRHKLRKGVLSSAQTHSQLSIEIHNEGIWILRLVSSQSGKSTKRPTTPTSPMSPTGDSTQSVNNRSSTDDSGQNASTGNEGSVEPEFLPWGIRAFEFLDSVVRGEIPMTPLGSGRRLDLSDLAIMTQTSGQVFCSITDLRTSEETAQMQRVAGLKEYESSSLADLEKKAADLTKLSTEHEMAAARLDKEEKQCSITVDQAVKDHDKAKKLTEEFTRRYRQYLGPDGRALPSKDREDLETKLLRYKSNLSSTDERVKLAREKHSDKKLKLQAIHASLKNAQRNVMLLTSIVKRRKALISSGAQSRMNKSKLPDGLELERAATRIKDVIGCLDKVAEKRRSSHNQKKSGHITSTWLHSNPELPSSFKKNVWRRMHRRKLQVVLRPSMRYLCDEVRTKAASTFGKNMDAVEEKIINAEKSFLQAYHPLADPSELSVPTSKSSDTWAEPGWRLDLSVPGTKEEVQGMLPRSETIPVLERNLSEISSVPGQQAAAFLSSLHLRSLTAPLSTFAIMSSPAEIPTVLETKVKPEEKEGDPFHITDADLRMGYSFRSIHGVQKSSAPQRTKNNVEDNSVKASSAKVVSSVEPPMNSANDRLEKKRRNQKSSDPSPRKRKKSEAAVTPNPSVPTSAAIQQPSNIRKPSSAAGQPRSKLPQVQTQQIHTNQSQEGNFPSPMQQQQMAAQLRMMPQSHPNQGSGYPPQGNMQQQMQKFYGPLGHQNVPSPRAPQYHTSMSPVARMQNTAGNRQSVSMPMRPSLGIPSTGTGQQNIPMGGRMMSPTTANQVMGTMGASSNPPARNRPMNVQAASNSGQRPQQNKQDGSGGSKQDQNDPLFMLK